MQQQHIKRLEGKVAIVTGGAHGIGKAYCIGLAREGAKVVIADLDLSAAEDVAKIIEDTGGDAIALRVDVSDATSTLMMARVTAEKFGTVDILINNAAICEIVPMSRVGLMEVEEEEWDRLMAVNLKGPWLCTRAVVPYMKEHNSGKIINISSGTVFGSGGGRPHYVASKAGVIGLTRNLARELGEYGINVNTLSPGSTLTEDLPLGADFELRKRAANSRALKQVETPEHLVGTAVFLSSNESDFITGQFINVDGGSAMY